MSRPIESSQSDILNTVATNVRDRRKVTGFSRRELSQLSGVSERYLAQLETGNGNVSVVLLEKIAKALGSQVSHFVSPKIRDDQNSPKANRVALIGLRGAGKSTLGPLVAKECNTGFSELNDEIERASAMPIHEVFALYDQEGYRRLEFEALKKIAGKNEDLIVAVGGGIVGEAQSYDYLLENFHTIWLKADAADHMARVQNQGDNRPMDGHPNAMRELQAILARREVAYGRADAMLNTSGAELGESALALTQMVIKRFD